MRRIIALSATGVLVLGLSGVRAAPVIPAETGRFYNILPPGQHGSANGMDALMFEGQGAHPAHFDDQLAMYANLVYNSPGLPEADITKYFKVAGFTVAQADVTRVENPRAGVTIVRDRFDIPHIYGNSAADVFFGVGYVTGEDRLFLTDVLRHVGEAASPNSWAPTSRTWPWTGASLGSPATRMRSCNCRSTSCRSSLGRSVKSSLAGSTT